MLLVPYWLGSLHRRLWLIGGGSSKTKSAIFSPLLRRFVAALCLNLFAVVSRISAVRSIEAFAQLNGRIASEFQCTAGLSSNGAVWWLGRQARRLHNRGAPAESYYRLQIIPLQRPLCASFDFFRTKLWGGSRAMTTPPYGHKFSRKCGAAGGRSKQMVSVPQTFR